MHTPGVPLRRYRKSSFPGLQCFALQVILSQTAQSQIIATAAAIATD
jgi:hypothetical protein